MATSTINFGEFALLAACSRTTLEQRRKTDASFPRPLAGMGRSRYDRLQALQWIREKLRERGGIPPGQDEFVAGLNDGAALAAAGGAT